MRFGLFGFLLASLVGISASANAGNIILNSGFESGDLSPWQEARDVSAHGGYHWLVDNGNAYNGSYSANVGDNYELRQNFSAIAASSISQIKFAALTEIMAFDFFYSDGSGYENIVLGGQSWQTYDITSYLDLSKDLVGISFWGNTGSPAYLDDVVVAANISRVPEPSSLMLVVIALLGLVSVRRFRA